MNGVIETIVGEYLVIEAFKEMMADVVKLLTESRVTFVFSENCVYVPLNW